MALMDTDGNTPLIEDVPQAEDYTDFTNPTNLLRAPSWIGASPAARPALVDRAMNAHLKELEAKPDKLVPFLNGKGEIEEAPMWTPAKTMTKAGREYVERSRQLFQTAAQDPEGGVYQDEFSGKWETSGWVDDIVMPQKKAFDPLHDLDSWKQEKQAITTEDSKPAETWEDFVAFSNADIKDGEAQIDLNNKELKNEWTRRMALADYDPRTMGDKIVDKVGGQYIINPDKYAAIDEVEATIEGLDIGSSEKRMLLMQHRDLVEKNAGALVNAFAAADAGPLGSIYSRPLNDEFNEAMAKPGASAYEFIKANKERFNKDNYGVSQELAETFRDAVMATGTGALWLGSAGNLTAPMEAWGGLAADSGKAYNNTKQFDVFGIDINRRDLTDLAGQLGSFVAMGGLGSLAGKGLVKAGSANASRYIVGAEGKLLSRAAEAAKANRVAVEAGEVASKTLGEKAAGVAKAIVTDSEVILGSLQSTGMSYSRTFNDEMERTGSREEAHKQAVIQGVGGGLGTFIATSVMNRFAKGAGKLLDGGDSATGGLVQNILSRVAQSATMKETQTVLGNLKSLTPEVRKAFSRALVSEMNQSAKNLGLRGYGASIDIGAEAIEETLDEVLADAITAISDDSKSWTEAEWDNIQNNWEGYIKAGVLGAIGGAAGGAQGAALNPRQTFGKSAALETQEDIWKRIKTNVAKFDSPGMLALEGRPDALRNVAEFVADPSTSIQDKAQVLVATARAKTVAMNSTFKTPAPTAPVAPVEASQSSSGTGTQPNYSKGSLGDLLTQAGVSVNDGEVWNDATLSEGPVRDIPNVGKVSLVSADTNPNGGEPHPVALKVVDANGTRYLSREQAMLDIPDAGFGKSMKDGLEFSTKDQLAKLFASNLDPVVTESERGVSVINIDEILSQGGGTVQVSDNGRSVNYKQFGVVVDGNTAEVAFVELDPSERGKGIGTKAYAALGKALAAKGIILQSSKAQYAAGRGVWKKLADQGLATKGAQGVFYFNPTAAPVPTASQSPSASTVEASGEAAAVVKEEGVSPKARAAEPSLATTKTDESTPETAKKEPKKAAPPAVSKPPETGDKDAGGVDAAVGDSAKQKAFVSRVGNQLKGKGITGVIGKKPTVTRQSIPGSASTRSSHVAEIVEMKESGLWVGSDGKVTIEPKLLDELSAKHGGSSNAVAAELSERAQKLKISMGSIKSLDALNTTERPDGGLALASVDRETALIVASDTIEKSQTDEIGGQWERVDLRSEQEKSQASKNAVQDGFGEKVVYDYAPAAGQTSSMAVGQAVLISGEPESILVLDSVENGKWRFRKVDLSSDNLRIKTLAGEERNLAFNRTRLTESAKLALPLVQSIVNPEAGKLTDLQKLFDHVVQTVAPGFSGKFVPAKLEGASFLQTDMENGVVKVDIAKLRRELHLLYRGVNTNNAITNEVLAADMARLLAAWTDEEVLHLLTMQEFEAKEVIGLYKDIASNPEHPFHELLKDTVEERLPGHDIALDSEEDLSVAAIPDEEGFYMIGAELLRKLHQLKNTGSFSEQAKYDSLLLQLAINKDTKDSEWGGPVKLIRTVAEMVRRYSNRVRNILWMRWQSGRLPQHQQAMLFKLEAAYKKAGVQGDTNYAQAATENEVVTAQRYYDTAHMAWGNEIAADNFRAVNQLRKIQQRFPNLKFGDLFTVDGGTQEMALNPILRGYLREHVSDFADVPNGDKWVEAPILGEIDKLLGALNDENAALEAGNTGLARAKQLVFLNYQVLQAKMAALDFDLTAAMELGTSNAGNALQRIGEHIANEVPVNQQAEHYRQLLAMDLDHIRAIEERLAFVREAISEKRSAKLELMNPYTPAGRLHILAEAKNVGLDNPFAGGGVVSGDVNRIMRQLQVETVRRVKNLGFFFESQGGQEYANLSTLKDQLKKARAKATTTEKAYLAVKAATPTLNESMQDAGEASRRMTRFLEFKQALDVYNQSVKNIASLAFGDIWTPPKEFGLTLRNLDQPTGEGELTRFLQADTAVPPTSNPDEVFGVTFQKVGAYLGYRPKKEYPKGGKPLTDAQKAANAYRDVLDRAANSNAAYVGRMAYVRYYINYMMGRIKVSEDPDTYRETGGFSLTKMRSENDRIEYRPDAAFRTIDVKQFTGLVFAAQEEAHKGAKSQNQPRVAIEALREFVAGMEKWSEEMLALVNPSKDENRQAPLILEMGGEQTLAGRIKPLLESQFARKSDVQRFNGEREADGLIALLDELHVMLKSGSHAVLDTELVNGETITKLRARLDGANDAAKLAGKALIEFGDTTWRKNVEDEASRAQRQASYDADNKEFLDLRDAPIDVRVISNLAFQIKFHEQMRDYQMGSTFAFEALEAYKSANRGEGVMPKLYRESDWKKIYPNTDTYKVPAYSKLEYDKDGNPFYWAKVERDNAQGNVTDPNAYGDERTNRAASFDDMQEARAGESFMSAAEIALDREASPEVAMRIWTTTYGALIGSQSASERLDVDAGRQFLFDLYALEQGQKSVVEAKQLLMQGLRGTFPGMQHRPNADAFYEGLYEQLEANGLSLNNPSTETVLVKLLELKRDFEASIVERARVGSNIDKALKSVRLAIGGGEIEVDEEFTEEVETTVPNPKWSPANNDSPFVDPVPRTLKQKQTVKKLRKIKKSALRNNSMASPEEAEGVARLIKGMMLTNSVVARDGTVSEALNVYDASLLVNGIDGIGNRILSLLATNLPGETLVVSPTEKQVTQFGLDDVGLKIFRGSEGVPNVIYAPSSQKNPQKNRTETFGGIAQALVMAGQANPEVAAKIGELGAALRKSFSSVVFAQSLDGLPNDVADHLESLGALGAALGFYGRGAGMLGMDNEQSPGLADDAMMLAEVLTNPEAKRLFDEAYIGTDSFENTLLSDLNEANLKAGLDAIVGDGTEGQEWGQDKVDNATEESVDIEDDGTEEAVDVDFTRPDVDWLEKMHDRLAKGELSAEEESEMLSTLFVRGDVVQDEYKPQRKVNRFGPDAQHINSRTAKLLGGNGLNPSDALLFNGLARILELGKASGGFFPQPLADPQREVRDILADPDVRSNEELAQAGPMLRGQKVKGLTKANAIYVGEMRNLTMPKVEGSTAAHIAFDFKRIQATNASIMLRSNLVRNLVGEVALAQAEARIKERPSSTSFGRVDVSLPLTDEMLDAIGQTLPEGMLADALASARASLANMELEQVRLSADQVRLMTELAAMDADAGEAFQQLLDNSPEGANLLATANAWSESLREQTRERVVSHILERGDFGRKTVNTAANLGQMVHSMLVRDFENNPQLKAATNGLYKQANELGTLLRERNRLTTPDENNEFPQGDVEGINSRISDAARMFNLHAKIFNSQVRAHVRAALRWNGVDPKKANYRGFFVGSFKDTDEVSGKQFAELNGEIKGMFNGFKLADGFIANMARQASQEVASGTEFSKGSAKPKAETNAFMQMVAEAYRDNPGINLRAFVEEKLNEALDDQTISDPDEGLSIGESFRAALDEIALTTAEARYILSSRAMSAEQRDARKAAEDRLRVTEAELKRAGEALEQIDRNNGTTHIGLGYYSERFMGRKVTVGAQLSLSMPPLASPDAVDGSQADPGTMSPRDYWTRSTAVQRALTEYSEESIDDAYKFVRGSTEQFLNFDPLKAINQAVALVEAENQVVNGLIQDARSDAQNARWKGMTQAAIAALTDPSEAMLLVKSAKQTVRQINTPQGWRKRNELIGQLINNDGETMVLLPANAKELLMRHWPQTVTKRNVNGKIKGMVLDALGTQPGKAYSYFLAGTDAKQGDAFDGTGFGADKQGITKGQAAHLFASDWKDGMKQWLNDAQNNNAATGVRGNKTLRTGDLYASSEHAFGYMIERLAIAHGDPMLSQGTRDEITALLKHIDSKKFVEIGTTGSGTGRMDVAQMLKLRVETVFSKAFSEIEEEAIRQRITTDFVSFDGKAHALELGALKYLHHQDARMRAQFRKSYAARQAAINLTAFLEYGVDGKSGRIGYTIAEKKMKERIARAAEKTGTGAKNQTIGYLLAVLNGIDQSFAMSKAQATNALVRDLGRGFHQLFNLNKAQEQYFQTDKKGLKSVLPQFNRYWNAHNIDLVRDLELARWAYDLMRKSKIDKVWIQDDADADAPIAAFKALLEAEIENGKEKEVEEYAEELNKSFEDISAAMQLTMAMLSRDAATELPGSSRPMTGQPWQDESRDAYRETYSSVPLRIGFASQPDPKLRSTTSSKFISDPADIVSFKDASFFGGYGRHEHYYSEKKPFRPIAINGLTAPLSLVDDAIYRLNVTPTYEVLRRAMGRSVTENGVSTIKEGHLLQKAQAMEPTGDPRDPVFRELRDNYHENIKHFREALSGIANEVETVMQNDAANGVLNTGGAEVMRFLGSGYIVRSLASIQQLWDQSASPSVGYSLGKIVSGQGRHAAIYFSTLGRLLTNAKFREKAREWVKQVDPMVYYRAADGADVVRNVMRSQKRFGSNKKKNLVGKGLRKYEEIGEMALDKTIGKTERLLATSIYLTELMGYMGPSYTSPEQMFSIKSEEIPTMLKTNSRRKVSDVMAMADQSRKSWMFQNRTSSPARNALWRSLVRFSNHTASMASNTSVMVPILFDREADEETKLEARENVVTTLAQNILFNPFKLRTLVPLILYAFFLAGDDDDEAQEKAQKLTNELLFSQDDDNMLQSIYKRVLFGKEREMFQQDKDPDAAQASALAELLTKSQVELLTAIPVFGAAVGYSPVSGLMQDTLTDRLSIAEAAGLNNMFNKRDLKQASSPYDANAVTIRQYRKGWSESVAALTAPGQMAYDLGAAGVLASRYNMTDYAANHRIASLIDTALYAAYEAIPFAREPRSVKRGELKEVVDKEAKRKK